MRQTPDEAVANWLNQQPAESIWTTAVTVFEIEMGLALLPQGRRRGQLEQLTEDHSLVEEQLRAGQITAAQAATSPMRNLITRAVGSQATVEVEIQSHHPQPGDIYLLASDGLIHEVPDEDISAILAEIPAPLTVAALTSACETLINTANRNGGSDNITVLLVAVAAS